MPAATAEKRARQRANKFSRTESTTIPIVPSAGTPELETLPTSANPVAAANSVALEVTPFATAITAATASPASSTLSISAPQLTKPSRTEPAPTSIVPPAKSPELVSLPAEPATSALPTSVNTDSDESFVWPIPAPATFTISYIPLAISYPEPMNSAAKLPTDAVRVTRTELANMLRQSYAQGTEHGWKENVGRAKERLQADYEKDMQDATTKFGLHEKLIREEEFERGFKDGRDVGRNTQLTSIKERLNAEYQKRHLEALENFASRSQEVGNEEFIRGSTSGRDAAVRDELERQASLLSRRVNSGTQTDILRPRQCLHVDFSSQTDLPEPTRFTSVGFGTQTDPLEPEVSIPLLPIPIVPSNLVINSPHISNNLVSVPPSPIPDLLALSTLTSAPDNPLTFISKSKPRSLSSPSLTFNIPPHPIKPSSPFIQPFPYYKRPITPLLISVPHPEPPTISIPPPPFLWSDEPSDIPLLPEPPPIPLSASKTTAPFPARDFSELRSGANPWQSLRRHRNGRDSRLSTRPFIQPRRQYSQPCYTSNYVSNIPHVHTPRPYAHVPHLSYPNLSCPSPPDPPPPLDWDVDPRLLQLSRVLKTLGWVRPSTPRP
ncbi:hypothetical protein GALMADRAFT_239099 [Galerina marginata CBS 339.88]|uniref:Uncharacterized protein n=1 Tax=Galerina marginata (strain CBS 339.88) TaxID=685588 RepID=A0A067TTJ0_GALM3|nr:hypothetical protein GALMADRAFT_239099 [Galerina marginata CBS 339.88]